MKKVVLPPNPSVLMEGLRDTGYDFNTALADIIDNSFDAGAKRISIKIVQDFEGELRVTVADDGCGMDQETLLNGMTYGSSKTAQDSRLGKFGLGLKTASTSFCRRLSVVTRSAATAVPLKAAWDLDHVAKVKEWELLLPEPDDEEVEELDELAQASSGTLVVWEKIDRAIKAYQDPTGTPARNAVKKLIRDFRLHAEMVYQRFLDATDKRTRHVVMVLNGEPLRGWSPFCESEKETEVVAEETVTVESDEGDSRGSFTVKAFVIPHGDAFSSDEAKKAARISNDNQGIYLYRENRLISHATWLGLYKKEPHITFLRIEFTFDHDLDEAFKVDIKKSQVEFDPEIQKWLRDTFLPAPRLAANKRSRDRSRKQVDDQAASAHGNSNAGIGSKEKDLRISQVEVTDPETGDVQVTNSKGQVGIRLRIGDVTADGQACVQTVDSIDDGHLWEPALVQQKHAVSINTGHEFYSKVYVPNYDTGVAVQGLDSLLWALAEAELGTIQEATKEHFKDLRYEVSRILRKLVADLPEPDLEQGEDQ